MNALKTWNSLGGTLCWLIVAALLGPVLVAHAALEEHFDVLQIGTHTYKNVTVTTKAKDYVFFMHSAGMTNVKVRDLPPELAQQLGYGLKPAGESKPALSWLKNTTSMLGKEQLPQLEQRLHVSESQRATVMAFLTPRWLGLLAGAMLLCYVFFSYCCSAICQKAGHPPGVLVWFPVLKLVPLLRAAGMSPWWLLGFLLPVINLIAQVIWSIKIVQARAKSPVLALLLLLPVTNIIAFLYLAFSDAAPPKEAPVVEIMTLDAA